MSVRSTAAPSPRAGQGVLIELHPVDDTTAFKRLGDQVGHADSTMTMDVYAQLQQRVRREHGTAFDRLVDQAREQL